MLNCSSNTHLSVVLAIDWLNNFTPLVNLVSTLLHIGMGYTLLGYVNVTNVSEIKVSLEVSKYFTFHVSMATHTPLRW